MLPNDFSNQVYWSEIYPQPLAYWQDTLERINRQHFHEAVEWNRTPLGRNIVFMSDAWVLKLGPPGWGEEMAREVIALDWAAGRLPVQTPQLTHSGSIDAWSYLIQRRLPGRNLHGLWKTLPPDQRERIALQHGEILNALHGASLPPGDVQKRLSFDWTAMISEQRASCAQEMRAAGVKTVLVDQVEAYLADTAGDLEGAANPVVLHGDLTHLNFLVEPAGPGWRIAAVIDWGDAKLGPPGHEYISPGVHMYLGDRPALASFYKGCGKALDQVRLPRELMARAMLYYSQDMATLLRGVPEIDACQDWEGVAHQLW